MVCFLAARMFRGKEARMKRLVLVIPFALACSSSALKLRADDGGLPAAGGVGGVGVLPSAGGGATGAGGAVGSGGTISTGGRVGSGGAVVSGGMSGKGGAAGVGGVFGTGGATGYGGAIASDGGASTCSSDQDCPSSQVCGYEADLTCSIQAHCITEAFCNSVAVGCGCDGGMVLVGCGVASKPFTGIGPCSNGTGGATSAGGTTGNGGSAAIAVSVTKLFDADVPPCAAGYEHPNICCQGAPYQATVCTEDLTHPFGVCETEQFAYPDPNACCLLDNKTACVQPPGVDSTPDAGQQNDCLNPCSPGAYPPPPLMDRWLCVFGIGITAQTRQPPCIGLCTRQGDWCSTPCPAGWSAPAGGQVDFCCQTGLNGQSFCFSQAGFIRGNSGP
jgi:hypothetical protein